MHFRIWLMLIIVNFTVALHELRCMNFYGLETELQNFVCSWQNDVGWYLDGLQSSMGINTIRLPFSYQYILDSDLSSMKLMIEECQKRDISIILDYHRTWSNHQGPTPEEGITLQEFEEAWLYVLNKFTLYENVMGVGIFNEIQNNDVVYLSNLSQNVMQTIEMYFPNRFYYFVGCINWGSDCSTIGNLLKNTNTWDRTFLDVHKYRFNSDFSEFEWDKLMPCSIPSDKWFVGEIGWKMSSEVEVTWASRFLHYLNKRNIKNVCLWTIAHSGDTEGWWKDNCVDFDYEKANMVTNTLWPLLPVSSDFQCTPSKSNYEHLP